MLAKILEVNNGKVILNETILVVKEFKVLYDLKGLPPFQYLWALYDPESPYMNYDEYDRDIYVKKDLIEPVDINDMVFVEAQSRCESMYNSPVRKILKGTKSAIEKLAAYFSTMEIESGRDGNIAQVKSAIVDMPKIIKAYMEAENAYKKEISRNRAGMMSAVDEDADDNYDE